MGHRRRPPRMSDQHWRCDVPEYGCRRISPRSRQIMSGSLPKSNRFPWLRKELKALFLYHSIAFRYGTISCFILSGTKAVLLRRATGGLPLCPHHFKTHRRTPSAPAKATARRCRPLAFPPDSVQLTPYAWKRCSCERIGRQRLLACTQGHSKNRSPRRMRIMNRKKWT